MQIWSRPTTGTGRPRALDSTLTFSVWEITIIPTQTEDLTGLPLALSLPLVQAIQVVLRVLYYR